MRAYRLMRRKWSGNRRKKDYSCEWAIWEHRKEIKKIPCMEKNSYQRNSFIIVLGWKDSFWGQKKMIDLVHISNWYPAGDQFLKINAFPRFLESWFSQDGFVDRKAEVFLSLGVFLLGYEMCSGEKLGEWAGQEGSGRMCLLRGFDKPSGRGICY